MTPRIVMLCGGVGGARGALSLLENLPSENLTFLVNTGDDFQHLGLEIWPDWDTVVYHLAGVQEAQRGWGRADEGTRVMEELKRWNAPDWFHLGDRDLALHLYRTWSLNHGQSRREICRQVCQGLGIQAEVLPLTEGGADTKLQLQDGRVMDFQEWFVEAQGKPEVRAVLTDKAESLSLTEGVQEALQQCDLVVYAPSNPYLSLGPMLANPQLRRQLDSLSVPKLAVSPLIGGKAVKGPLDSLLRSLSPHQGQSAIAHYWKKHADALLLPAEELQDVQEAPLALRGASTWLKTPEQRKLFWESLLQSWEEFR